MSKFFLTPFVLVLLMWIIGCGNFQTKSVILPNAETQNRLIPVISGAVGYYTFAYNDGTVEQGNITLNEKNKYILAPYRQSSVESNRWFIMEVDYIPPRNRYYIFAPIYFEGDIIEYNVRIEYLYGFNLEQFPILHASMSVEQRYWPSLAPVPGNWRETWDPLVIQPHSSLSVFDTYQIPMGVIPGCACMIGLILMEFPHGTLYFALLMSIYGIWDF